MNKIIRSVHFVGVLAVIVVLLQVGTSISVLHQQTYERLRTVQDMQIGALDTSSNVARRFDKPEFWEKGKQVSSDDFYPINAVTGKSLFNSQLTGLPISHSAKGFTEEPKYQIRVGYRDVRVFSVGRAYVLDGVRYELLAKTDVSQAYRNAWKLLALHLLSILTTLFLYRVAISYAGSDQVPVMAAELSYLDRIKSAMLNEFGDGAAAVLEDGTILFTNTQFQKDMLYSADELVGRSFNMFVAPDRADWHTAQMADSLLKNEDVTYRDVKPYQKGGTQITVNLGIKWLHGRFRGKKVAIATIRKIKE